jgi:hypothetical protein
VLHNDGRIRLADEPLNCETGLTAMQGGLRGAIPAASFSWLSLSSVRPDFVFHIDTSSRYNC